MQIYVTNTLLWTNEVTFGISGRGAGSLIGGYLIENVGIFNAFRIIAAIGGSSGVFYWLMNFLFFRNRTGVVDVEKDVVIGKDSPDLRKEEGKSEKGKKEEKLTKETETKKENLGGSPQMTNGVKPPAQNGRVEGGPAYDNKAFECDKDLPQS